MKQPENCPSLKRTKNEKALILKNRLENICEDKLKTDPVRIVPPTTDSKTKWALRYFAYYAEWRNKEHQEEPVPENLLYSGSVSATELNKWVSYFVIETRRKDGQGFPSATTTLLLQGIRHHKKGTNEVSPNFLLDAEQLEFASFHGV